MKGFTLNRNKQKKNSCSIAGAVFLVALWYLAALALGAEILLPTPMSALSALLRLVMEKQFWESVAYTILRGLAGFILSFVAGLGLGVVSGKNSAFRMFTNPFLVVTRSTPVMSFILLAMIWFKSDYVPVFVSFLMAFPIVMANVTEGVSQVDEQLLQMAAFFRVSKRDVFFGIELPSIFPFLMAGAEASLGLSWKVVIAAEVLSQPVHAIGTKLQNAKVYLETSEVFAWTVVAVFLSAFTELVFRFIMKKWSAGS